MVCGSFHPLCASGSYVTGDASWAYMPGTTKTPLISMRLGLAPYANAKKYWYLTLGIPAHGISFGKDALSDSVPPRGVRRCADETVQPGQAGREVDRLLRARVRPLHQSDIRGSVSVCNLFARQRRSRATASLIGRGSRSQPATHFAPEHD